MTIDLIQAVIGFAVVTGVGALAYVIQWAWTHTHKRIDDVVVAVDTKAPTSELNRVRDTQKDIFDKFDQHDRVDHERFGQIAMALGRVEGKVEALLNRQRSSERDK